MPKTDLSGAAFKALEAKVRGLASDCIALEAGSREILPNEPLASGTTWRWDEGVGSGRRAIREVAW